MITNLFQYEYLVGGFILALIWSVFILFRKDLYQVMIWSSLWYFGLFVIGLIVLPLLNNIIPPEMTFNPGYWQPNSLWDLNRKTGGAGIEDGVFMFFVGGIAAASYEVFFRKTVGKPKKSGYRLHALKIGFVAMIFFVVLFRLNLIWPLIVFALVTAFNEVKERHDLWAHAVWGGITFFLIYLLAFKFFNFIYPDFILGKYNLDNLSGIIFWGLPVEELLYALSFGVMWAPIYEYITGAKDKDLKSF